MNMQNPNLNFELTIEETNLVLEALGQLPFVRVFNLIGKLQDAARGQVEQAVAVTPPAGGVGERRDSERAHEHQRAS